MQGRSTIHILTEIYHVVWALLPADMTTTLICKHSCVSLYYVKIKTFNTRNILNSKMKILLLWRHVSVQGTILRPSLYVMPTRTESGIKLRLKLLHW
jgi:hypothetical protein